MPVRLSATTPTALNSCQAVHAETCRV
jgi:hypothetical protein